VAWPFRSDEVRPILAPGTHPSNARKSASVCNLYSMTKNVDEIRRLFGIDPSHDRSGDLPLLPGFSQATRRRGRLLRTHLVSGLRTRIPDSPKATQVRTVVGRERIGSSMTGAPDVKFVADRKFTDTPRASSSSPTRWKAIRAAIAIGSINLTMLGEGVSVDEYRAGLPACH